MSKNEKYPYMIFGILTLLYVIIHSPNYDYSFLSTIITLVFHITIIIGSFVLLITDIFEESIKSPLKIKRIVIYAISVFSIIPAAILLNGLLGLFGFSFRDIMIIFQMIGFLLLIPIITPVITKLIDSYLNNHELDVPYDWTKLVIAYAILIILVGSASQTDALQYFVYDNNLK